MAKRLLVDLYTANGDLYVRVREADPRTIGAASVDGKAITHDPEEELFDKQDAGEISDLCTSHIVPVDLPKQYTGDNIDEYLVDTISQARAKAGLPRVEASDLYTKIEGTEGITVKVADGDHLGFFTHLGKSIGFARFNKTRPNVWDRGKPEVPEDEGQGYDGWLDSTDQFNQ